jgi:hypothetical protein
MCLLIQWTGDSEEEITFKKEDLKIQYPSYAARLTTGGSQFQASTVK